MRYQLSESEGSIIRPMLPNKSRGVPRVDDRRTLDGIFWVLKMGCALARFARAEPDSAPSHELRRPPIVEGRR